MKYIYLEIEKIYMLKNYIIVIGLVNNINSIKVERKRKKEKRKNEAKRKIIIFYSKFLFK